MKEILIQFWTENAVAIASFLAFFLNTALTYWFRSIESRRKLIQFLKAIVGALEKATPAAALLLAVGFALSLSGCAGTFEESSGKLQVGSRKTVDQVYCREISNRARWEKALATAGAITTGATGIAAWPVEGKQAELALAIGSTVLASGTVLVLTLYESDAAEYIEAGCATPKAVVP